MGVEIELKLAATPEMLTRLLADPLLRASHPATPETAEQLISTYFDTSDSRLHEAGACLRLREQHEAPRPPQREQTLKLTAPRHAAIQRQEWNVAHDADSTAPAAPDPALFPPAPRATLAQLLTGEPLLALGATHVTRIRRRIHYGTATIDIMADSGEIRARSAPHQPICELELELVSGESADLLRLAASLPLGPDLMWQTSGKGARCRALAHGVPLRATLAAPVTLSPTMDIASGFHTIGWACLGQLLANYPLVLASGDPEAVHQSRVAIRRLRAAFSLFGEHLADEQTASLRAGFKEAAAALAPARDRHVLLARLRPGLPPKSPLLAHLVKATASATAAAQQALAAEPFQRLLISFALWLEQGAWRSNASAPLAPAASAILARRQRKLRRLARALDPASDEQLHALRIEAKKLRYALAFLGSLFPTKRQRQQIGAQEKLLSRLQDDLGDLHDIAVSASSLANLFAGLSPARAAALAAELAAHTSLHQADRPRLLRRATKRLAKNADTPRWWQD